MNYFFKNYPRLASLMIFLAGIITAFGGINALEKLAIYLNQISSNSLPVADLRTKTIQSQGKEIDKFAPFDQKSMFLPAERIQGKINDKNDNLIKINALTETDLLVAHTAWQYFEHNWNEETGLVNSVDNFNSVTLWDQSAAIAALVSAFELEIINQKEFESKMNQTLATISKLSLYNDELPNKVYNSKTLIPVNYGKLDQREKIGWSAIDIGRFSLWLKIVENKYPQFKNQTDKIWQSWQIKRLTNNQEMYGTSVNDGQENYYQEGRLGYENYAAYGLKLWGLQLDKALDYENKTAFVSLYNVSIPFDIRDYYNSEANNYVLSEPYLLDGIETGFQALPKNYAEQILKAQEARYEKTGQLTALTEDNLDRPPYFVYNTLYVNGKPWGTITDTRENYNHLRFLSSKAAIGWYVLFPSEYTEKIFNFVTSNLKSDKGWYNGYYENLQEPNQALTANNNGIILETILYKKVQEPLINWANIKPLSTSNN